MSSLFNFRKPAQPGPYSKGTWQDGSALGALSGYYRGPSIPWRWTPRVVGPHDYPMDADPSERFMRPKRGIDFFPYPYLQITAELGVQPMMSARGILPKNDPFVWAQAIGKNYSGPIPWFNLYMDSGTSVALPQAEKQI